MAYPFVAARWYTAGARAAIRGTLWHMAEGYGTVGYLSRVARNVSADFVVDRFGQTTQMVRWADASHSARVAFDDDTNDASDCAGLYGERYARAVLGSGLDDVNRYVVSVEVEGYRARGPNAVQVPAMVALSDHIRARGGSDWRGNIGHRDVQDYKACPGCLFPWDAIGGHGLRVEDDMLVYAVPGIVSGVIAAGTVHRETPNGKRTGTITAPRRLLLLGQDRETSPAWYLVDGGGTGAMRWVPSDSVSATRDESYAAGVKAATNAAATAARSVV